MTELTVSRQLRVLAAATVLALVIGLLAAGAISAAPSTPHIHPPTASISEPVQTTHAAATASAAPAKTTAATTYVRVGGDDVNCDGTVDVDYSSGLTACAVKTIQKGIDLVDAGGTVNVATGTFTENLIVAKALTLSGAGQSSTTIIPAVSNPNPCSGSSLCGGATSASNIIVVQASDVTITAMTLDGDNPALTSGFVRGGADVDARNGIITDHSLGILFDNLQAHHLTVKNIYLRGMYASSGGSFNFHHNTVTNVQGDDYSIAMFAWGGPGTMADNTVSYANDAISANHSKGIQFTNNVITHSGSGVHTDNSNDGGGVADLIQGNTVSDCATDGYGIFVFVPYVAPTVNNNTITNCAVGLSAWGQGAAVTTNFTNNVVDGANLAGSTGVYVTTDLIGWGYTDISVSFSNNVIKNNANGLFFTANQQSWNSYPYEAKTITAVFSNNSISGNTVTAQVDTQGTYNIDASSNWWGSADSATVKAAANGGAVIDFTPWLNSGTDTSGSAGFQGDFTNLWVDDDSPQTGATGRVQEGVNLVSAGGTANIAPGTYNSAVTTIINKALTLGGPTSGVAKLQGTDSAVVPVLEISSSNVTVQNLEITHSMLPAFGSVPWTETQQCLVCVRNGAGLTGISISGNIISVSPQSGAMSTWSGIALTVQSNAAAGISITNNTVRNVRNGIVVQYGNTATVSNNTIYSTKGGIMNYTLSDADAGQRTMSGNAWDTAHNEWDIVWNSGGNYAPADRTASVLGVSSANNDAYVVDRRALTVNEGSLIHNRSHIFVDAASSVTAAHPAKGNQNEPFKTLELARDAVIEHGTIYVRTGAYTLTESAYPGGLVITGSGTTISLNGATIGAGSPALTITADDVEVNGPGTLDGSGSGSSGVLVQSGADNFTLKNVELKNWANGVEIAGAVTSLKLMNNFLWGNATGLRVDSGATLGGVITVQGNLFKANTGAAIVNNNGASFNAEYNSFASTTCPGISDVDVDPCTFAEVYVDLTPGSPDNFTRGVVESVPFDVEVRAEAKNVYGVTFKLSYETTKLTYNSITWEPAFVGKCFALDDPPVTGQIGYNCNLMAAWNGGPVATLNFTPTGAGLVNPSPWTTDLNVDHVVSTAGTNKGALVYLNNVKLADVANTRDITDANDGRLTITGIGQYTGFIDLQGRSDDSGAALEVWNQQAVSGATKMATATSAKGGAYTTAYVSALNPLQIGATYYFFVDKHLYVRTAVTTAGAPPAVTSYDVPWLLGGRPLTTLSTLELKGGDADNSEDVDIPDATCIGGAYGKAGPWPCGANGGTSDVNSDGKVDILDLTLMGGNYGAYASVWP